MDPNLEAGIQEFLEKPGIIKKMIAATNQGRPALEPVIPCLMMVVPGNYSDATIRQDTGRIAKKVMKNKGYVVKEKGVPLQNYQPFETASRYIKK